LLLACLGAACRAVTGVAGGATRMALTQHFALADNAADIAAKEGSQETAVTLAGMAAGLALTRLADASAGAAWAAFAALTAVHIWANVRALRCLRMASLNRPRLDLLLRAFLGQQAAAGQHTRALATSALAAAAPAALPSPAEVAALESLLAPPAVRLLSALRLRPREPALLLAPSLGELGGAARRRVAQALGGASLREAWLAAVVVPESAQVVVLVGAQGAGASAAVLDGGIGSKGVAAADRDAERLVRAYCAGRAAAWRAQSGGGGALARACPLARPLTAAEDAAAAALVRGAGEPDGFAFGAALAAAGWALARPALGQGAARAAWGAALGRAGGKGD
jgi:hypothetical protein